MTHLNFRGFQSFLPFQLFGLNRPAFHDFLQQGTWGKQC